MAVTVPASVKGVITGVVSLAALDLFLSSDKGTAAFGWAVTAPTSWIVAWLDPTKPLITDQRTQATASGGTGSTPSQCKGLTGSMLAICQRTGLVPEAGAVTPPTTSLPAPAPAQPLSI